MYKNNIISKSFCLLFLFISFQIFSLENLVKNNGFDDIDKKNGTIKYWSVAGAKEIKLSVSLDNGFENKGKSLKFECNKFSGSNSDSHAMVCQVGQINLNKNKWYKLVFTAKQNNITTENIQVAIVNTKSWNDIGFNETVTLDNEWNKYELFFKASADLQDNNSRLQFWFKSTGTLWLYNVGLFETPEVRSERFPQILKEDNSINLIKNGSFECGTSGWGSYSIIGGNWWGNIYKLIGELDNTTSVDGKNSLKVELSKEKPHVLYWDILDLSRKEITNIFTANIGWFHLTPDKIYTLSVYLKTDNPDARGYLMIHKSSDDKNLTHDFKLSKEWKKYDYTFRAKDESIWVGAGFNISQIKNEKANLWIDAIQLEAYDESTRYKEISPIQVTGETKQEGNIFTTEKIPFSIPLILNEYNSTDSLQEENVKISVTDFYNKEVFSKIINVCIPGKSSKTENMPISLNAYGFYNINLSFEKEKNAQKIRCAIIKPFKNKDSRFGLNHAYPWNHLIKLSQKAGLIWWRDWSTQWGVVQKEKDGHFDFSEPDIQMNRILKENGKILALLPFPSTEWNSTANIDEIKKLYSEEYRQKAPIIACKPDDMEAFKKYLTESINHNIDRTKYFQIFNEPIYTTNSLPAKFGYKVDDYIDMLSVSYKTIKEKNRDAVVIGGIGKWPYSKVVKEFVEHDGLKYVDIFDVHLYPTGSPEYYQDSLKELTDAMQKKGINKDIWLTELGCYGEDDIPMIPFIYSDKVMQQSFQPDEKRAAEWLVKFATIFFANNGKKIFFHAGTCGEINGIDIGSTFFKYYGAPRKIYPVISAISSLLPPEAVFDRVEKENDFVSIYWFKTEKGDVGVVWALRDSLKLKLSKGIEALDIQGNEINSHEIIISKTPCYLIKK
jgi:hypothetical protein